MVGNALRAFDLMDERIALQQRRVQRFKTAELALPQCHIQEHGHPAHALHAAGHHIPHVACGNGLRTEMHRLLAGPAHAVQGYARHAFRQARQHRRQATDVGPLLARLADAAGDQILDLGARQSGARKQPLHRLGQQRIRARVGPPPAAAAEGRSHRFHDHGFVHASVSSTYSVSISFA
ncbi:hypothetical protein G6F65_017115 [Rhizopus arrhizus]|nr:hypothetical protein G6F65_017115 [Rhizopus arrhizus]